MLKTIRLYLNAIWCGAMHHKYHIHLRGIPGYKPRTLCRKCDDIADTRMTWPDAPKDDPFFHTKWEDRNKP